jgi:M6 family metalloprotease-like protein
MLLLVLCAVGFLQGAPFARKVSFTRPDGSLLELWGQGDEFQAVFESLDGYTVFFDPNALDYYYATLSAGGTELVSSGIAVGQGDPALLGLPKHLRLRPEIARARAQERRRAWESVTRTPLRWKALKARRSPAASLMGGGPSLAPPSSTTVGQRCGLTLLIDFSDAPATVPAEEIEAFCNSDSYTGFGNNGSVKDYFLDNSNGLLVYTNTVTFYVRMLKTKAYYNDVTKGCGAQGNLLIKDALAILKARSDYETLIRPTFNDLTVDSDGWAIAFNVFYAGGNGGVWAKGLWPHSYALVNSDATAYEPVDLLGGKFACAYQITDIGASLELGTFCHENGHMLCGYPDIYDYGYDSVGGAGAFCLMNSGGHGTNPAQICAYLKHASGWTTVTDIDSTSSFTGTLVAAPVTGYNHIYRYPRPGVATEYFLLENRQQIGRDAGLPASGVAIWHIDELGDRDNQSLITNSVHANYEVTLMQADGRWDFEHDANGGDAQDLYQSLNSRTGYLNRFDDNTTPGAYWWDGTPSGASFCAFSASGTTMTFLGGLPAPVLAPEPARTSGTDNAISWSAGPLAPPPLPAPSPALSPVGADATFGSAMLPPGLPVQTNITFPGGTQTAPRGTRIGAVPVKAFVASSTIPSQAVPASQTRERPTLVSSELADPSGPLPQIIVTDTFESGSLSPYWDVSGAPTWGTTTSESYGGTQSAWCAGSSLTPSEGYTDGMNAWMVHGPFSLAQASAASWSFATRVNTELDSDTFGWFVSADGVNYSGYIVSGSWSWQTVTMDLAASPLGNLCGQSAVYIAFIFQSNGSVSGPTYTGAFVDDIAIDQTLANGPDLAAPEFSFSTNQGLEESSVSVSARVANEGNLAAGSSHARLYLAVDNDNLVSNDLDLGEKAVGALAVGASEWVTWDFPLPNLGTVNYPVRFLCVVDSAGELAERSENNTFLAGDVLTAFDPPEYYAESGADAGFASFTPFGWTAGTAHTFTGYAPGETRWYRVQARRGPTQSAWSNVEFSRQSSVIQGRYIFYNGSSFDGGQAAANAADDNAIATDKTALLPGQKATFANYTSYSRGINGIMLDVTGLGATPTAGDFDFKVGNSSTLSAWATAPGPTSVTLRAGVGIGGSDRVTLIWANGAVKKEWLQVTMLANANSGLAADSLFYFGNAVGETGDGLNNADVLVNDALRILNHMNVGVGIENLFDMDRDGNVLVQDALICLNNMEAGSTALQFIDLAGVSGPAAVNPGELMYLDRIGVLSSTQMDGRGVANLRLAMLAAERHGDGTIRLLFRWTGPVPVHVWHKRHLNDTRWELVPESLVLSLQDGLLAVELPLAMAEKSSFFWLEATTDQLTGSNNTPQN